MSHSHEHSYPSDHSHGTENVSDGVLKWAVVINVGLSVFEFIAGFISGSVALMADALHNTNDAAALLIAYIARKVSKRRADKQFTFGYRRAELIGAMIQLTALILVGFYLVYEAIHRLFAPEPLLGAWIMAAASVALVIDVLTAWLLWSMSKGSLNVKAAFLHNLTDAAASIAVLLGGAAVYWLGWIWIDPLLSLMIAGYILYMSVGLIKRTIHILMEAAPEGLDVNQVEQAMEAIEGVDDVHHLHVWELDEEKRALEAHVVIHSKANLQYPEIKKSLKSLLHDRFHITHSTLEFEEPGEDCDHQRC